MIWINLCDVNCFWKWVSLIEIVMSVSIVNIVMMMKLSMNELWVGKNLCWVSNVLFMKVYWWWGEVDSDCVDLMFKII